MRKSIKYSVILFVAILCFSAALAQSPASKCSEDSGCQSGCSHRSKCHKPSVMPTPPDSIINGFGYVDLGLPSGLKWATCNVGASNPENYGTYFSWGETTAKDTYDEDNSPTYKMDLDWLRENGYLDFSDRLTTDHDAARQNMDGSWRMPTISEIDELIENTTSEWVRLKGVNGRLVISKTNGKNIFLPAAGWYCEALCNRPGNFGSYWSATPYEGNDFCSYDLYFATTLLDSAYDYRYEGRTVRGVSF